ncbi:4-hydroxyphenylpyruvate dioxygenase [Zea mays]|uniref:4-hydroxyphenylpyruvate dioxygenase n=1 Tax=Zea mays TaxID=4577 RepID=A0A1D6HX48_MAIZE|nr:4-hydroxyphenylpyruvate dioxygenase [Zea mays]ONM52793.1 phytoene desaturation 1 [Zea mays]|eukprot:XP_008653702.1 4-hydroxyphenylpyruvate dioxygenase [Zea mays]
MPTRRQLPTALRATKTLHPVTPVVTADRAADFAGTDRFHVIDFHHVEFWCADAASAAGRFSFALGVPLAAQSDLTTGNTAHASRLLRSRSGPLAFLFTAPYAAQHGADDDATAASSSSVLPSFSADAARRFAADYGLAVRAVAIRVSDAAEAFRASVDAGARPAFAPAELGHGFVFAEVELYGDAVLRFVSYPDGTDVSFLPGFENVASSSAECPDYGLNRFDHIVGGVPDLAPVAAYIAGFTGFHEFHRVNGNEVGTAESSLNGLVLANSSEHVLLTLLEPVQGTKRRSQIQTFLDHHGGPGVQHLAMASDDLIGTLREIRARSSMGGFELLPPPPPSYYDGVRRLAGDVLSEAQIKECQELGVRVDKGDNGGVVLQIFTKAAGDRPTLLLEFIQRIGCVEIDESGRQYQKGGCGGFAKDNVIHLVKSIEDYDKTLDAPARVAS